MHTAVAIGDMILHRIVELEIGWDGALAFLPALTAPMLEQARPDLPAGALDAEDRIVLCFQSHLVQTPHHTILIDTCIGNDKHRAQAAWRRRSDGRFMAGLAAAGLRPEDIDVVLCTHLHPDHVGWNTRLENGRWVPTFPRARYLFSRLEFEHWTAQAEAAAVHFFDDSVLPIVAAGRAELVGSAHTLSEHVRLLPTPGHTIDHFSVELGATAAAVVSGDVLHSPLQVRWPHLSFARDADPARAATTRRAFLERYCDTQTRCCFSHFAGAGSRLTRHGDGFRCMPCPD